MQLFPFGHATHPQWQMAAGLVLAQLPERPERVAQRSGSQQHDLAVAVGDAIAECPAKSEVVLGISRLTDADGDPPLVWQALAQEFPQIGSGIEDR